MMQLNKQFGGWVKRIAIGLFICAISLYIAKPVFAQLDIEAMLDTTDGTSGFDIMDQAGTTQSFIDSDGNIVTRGCVRLDDGLIECTTAETLIVDGTIGIGTLAPASVLHIDSNVVGTTPVTTMENTAGDFQFFVFAGDPLGMVTGNPGDLSVDPTGGMVYIKASGAADASGWTEVSTGGGMPEWDQTGNIIHPRTAASEDVAIGGTTEIGADVFFGANGRAVINEQGNNVGLRVEGTSLENLFVTNGTLDAIGIGTSTPGTSVILDLSSATKALRVTRVSDPATDITTPTNGMIAYDSTDDQLQAYINGSWLIITENTSNVFVMMSGDSMTGTLEMSFRDPTIQFLAPDADSDFTIGINDDAGADDDDVFQISRGTTLNTPLVTITTDGQVGIGTSTPSTDLDVIGTITASDEIQVSAGTAADPSFTFTADPDTGLFSGGADELGIAVGGTDVIRIMESGGDINIGIGTSTPASSALLDLSASDRALRITRVSDPATDIVSPQNGMLAYDSTDDQLQAYINGSWSVITQNEGDTFVMMVGDSMTGTLDMNFLDPSIRFVPATTGDTNFWIGIQDDAGADDNDAFQIGEGLVPGTNAYLTIDSGGRIGVGTSSPDQSTILDLSASDRALRLTRVAQPNLAIASPRNGMIAYDTTDDELEAYIEGTWRVLTIGTSDDFVMAPGDTMTGTLDMNFFDPGIRFISAGGGDTNFWVGVLDDAGNDFDDTFQIGVGTTIGTSSHLTIDSSGRMGVGTSTPGLSSILELSSAERALRVTRLSTPSSEIASPQNGMIAYNSVDDMLQAYIAGTWENLVESTSNVFVMMTGDSMTGELVMDFVDPAVRFEAPGADSDYWIGITDDGGADNDDPFQIGLGATAGSGALVTITTEGMVGIGTSTLATSAILELSSSDKALRVTRLLQPSSAVSSPQNGMIAYDSTDDEMEAYINGTWRVFTIGTSDEFVMVSGDTMTGTLEMSFRDPTIQFLAPGADTDFTVGIQDDAGADDNDVFVIGLGTTLNTPLLTISSDGQLTVATDENSGTLTVTNDSSANQTIAASSTLAVTAGADISITPTTTLNLEGATGIQDATPDADLEVSADGATTGEVFMLSSDDASDGDLFVVTRLGTVGVGTNSPADSTILDLSASDRALRLTRVAQPNLAIASPRNGMIAYDTTDDELEAYIEGTWRVLTIGTSDDFVMAPGDTMTGTLDMNFFDPGIRFISAGGGDTNFWVGVLDDAGNDFDDTFQIGVGTTIGTSSHLTIDSSGRMGVGTSTPGLSSILELSSAERALRVTRLSTPSSEIASPQNGMIAYNSADDMLQAYIAGTWENLVESTSNVFVMMTGDSMTGELVMDFVDPAVRFEAPGADSDYWIGITDDGGADNDDPFQIGLGATAGSGALVTITTEGMVGIGTSTIGTSVLLDLSSADKALRLTRVSDPLTDITTPRNGMILYDSTDDELEAYIEGTWRVITIGTSDDFVMAPGDTMTGTLEMSFRDPTIQFLAPGADTDFTVGIQDDAGADDNDVFIIGLGTTLNTPLLTISSDGQLTVATDENSGTLTVTNDSSANQTIAASSTLAVTAGADISITPTTTLNLEGATGIQDATPDADLEVSADGSTTGDVFMLSSDDASDGDLFVVTRLGTVGVGTASPGLSTILDLSATDKALRVTRLVSPSSNIASPLNGMIAYDSTDDQLQAYIGGTWENLVESTSNVFVMMAGDSMTGTLEMSFTDPTIKFFAPGADSDFTIGINDDGGSDNNDSFVISAGTTLNTPYLTITTDGTIDLSTASLLKLPGGISPVIPTSAGEIVIDSNFYAGQGILRYYDGYQVSDVVATIDTPADGQVPKWDMASGTILWETDNDSGFPTWNQIQDATGASTIDYLTFTETIETSITDATGGTGLIMRATDLGAGTSDVTVLRLETTSDDDPNFIPLSIQDDSAVTPDTILTIDYAGNIVTTGSITTSGTIVLDAPTDPKIEFTPDGGDSDFTIGVQDDDGGDDNDVFIIGGGTSLNTPFLTISTDGQLTVSTDEGSGTLALSNSAAGAQTIAASGALSVTSTSTITLSNDTGIQDTSPDADFEVSADGVTTGEVFMLSSDDANDGDLFVVTRLGTVGIGTNSPADSTILDLSATNAALRITRLVSPSANIASPQNGMIAYDSTDDEMQAYIGGTWVPFTIGSTDAFVMSSGDSMTGTLDMNFADASIRFIPAVAGDSDFWVGVQDDGAGDDNDTFQIGQGTTTGSSSILTITTDGQVAVGTSTPATSAILDLSATDKALRVTRLTTPSSAISSPQNGMIAYNSTDDVMQVYANGTWATLADTDGNVFVMMAGDSMTGELVMDFVDPAVRFEAPGADSDYWIGITDDGGSDNDDPFQIGLGATAGSGTLVTITTEGMVGIGTSTIPTSVLLDLSASDKALRLTRVIQPSTAITSPQNGMIAYDSTDDEVEAYIAGTWVPFTTGTVDAFVMSAGDSMTGTLDMNFADASIRFIPATSGDADFWVGVQDDASSDTTGDSFQIGLGTVTGTTPFLTITTTGTIELGATTDPFITFNPDGNDTDFVLGVRDNNNGTSDDVFIIAVGDTINGNNFVMRADGDIGIGISAPTDEFEIVRSQNAATALSVNNPTDGAIATSLIELDAGGSNGSVTASAPSHAVSSVANRFSVSGFDDGLNLTAAGTSGDIQFFTEGSAATNEKMRLTTDGTLGIGTSTPGVSTILDLSATNAALRITRVSDPSSDILSPQNGMIAYDSTDDELQAYINGSWSVITQNEGDTFVMMAGDSMTGTLDMNFRDPTIRFLAPSTDSDFTIGINDDAGTDDDDAFVISRGTTLNTPLLTVTTSGMVGIGTSTPGSSAILDLSSTSKALRVTQVTDPSTSISNPENGMIVYDSTDDQTQAYINGSWQKLADGDVATYTVASSTSVDRLKADYQADGTADQVEIEAAITALPADGGVVMLLEGTFTITGEINITTDNVRLVGTGAGTGITYFGNAAGISIIDVAGADQVYIGDMILDGTPNTLVASGIVVQSSSTNTTIENVIVDDATFGIMIIDAINTAVRSNIVQNNNSSGIGFNGSSEGSVAEGNIVTGNGGNGIRSVSDNVSIINNQVLNSSNEGIELTNGADNNIVANNRIESSATVGIDITGGTAVTNSVITGNVLVDNGAGGASDHINVDGASGLIITDNIISDTAGTGQAIDIDSASENILIADNIYSGTGASEINDAGVGTRYTQFNRMTVTGTAGGFVDDDYAALKITQTGLSSIILDLSATDAALRVTRLTSPSGDIASAQNGMIAYDSTDDQLQAYIGGTWENLVESTSNVFVMMAGDSMTGTLDMNFADASIRFIPAVAGDSDFWIGVQDDGAGTDNDTFEIGAGTATGSNSYLSITTDGTIDLSGSQILKIPAYINPVIPTSDGEMVLDINFFGGTTGQGIIRLNSGQQETYVVATTDSSPADGQVPKFDLASGTIQWLADADSGAPTWNSIQDADNAGTLDFDTFEQRIDTSITDVAGGVALRYRATDLGAGTADLVLLNLEATADNDTNFIPLRIQDDIGGTADTILTIDYAGNLVTTGSITTSGTLILDAATDPKIEFTPDGADSDFTIGVQDDDANDDNDVFIIGAGTSLNTPFLTISTDGQLTVSTDEGSGTLALSNSASGSQTIAASGALSITTPSSITLSNLTGVQDATPDADFEVSADGAVTGEIFMLSSNDANDGDLFVVTRLGTVGVGTATPADSTILDLSATNAALRITRLVSPSANIANPQNGMIAYDSTDDEVQAYIGGTWIPFTVGSTDAFVMSAGDSMVGTLDMNFADASIRFIPAVAGDADFWIGVQDDASGDATGDVFQIGEGTSVGSSPFFTITTDGQIGVGTSTIPTSVLLDLSATDKALRVTRLTTPSSAISSPQNGMIAYNSTDDELQAYVNGTWTTLADTDGNVFVMMAGDSMTGTLEMSFRDPTIQFLAPDADSDFTIGIQDDAGADDNDVFIIAGGTTLNTPYLTITTTGSVTLGATSTAFIVGDSETVGIGTSTPAAALNINGGAIGVDLLVESTGTGGADVIIRSGGTSDSYIQYQLNGSSSITEFTMGVDNSDSDKFKITTESNFTTSDFTIDETGNVAIGTADTQASILLDLSASDKALRVTRLVSPSANIASPQNGMIAYDSTDDEMQGYIGGTWIPFTVGSTDAFVMSAGDSMTGTLDMNFRDPTIRFLAPSTDSDFTIGVSDDSGTDDDDLFVIGRGTTLNNPLFVVTTTGSIGIGTTAPLANLHIEYAGDTGITDMANLIINNSTAQGGAQLTLGEDSGASLDGFHVRYNQVGGVVNNLEFVSFDNLASEIRTMVIERDTGEIGIGNTEPTFPLEVNDEIGLTNPTGDARLTITAEGGDFDPMISFSNVTAHTPTWTLGLDDSANDSFVITNGDTLGDDLDYFTITTDGSIGIGTTNPGVSAILDLSSATGALRVTRVTDPSVDIVSPQNGMIAYDSTDNQLQAYISGSWQVITENTSDVFVMMAGDSMTGTLDMFFDDASVRFNAPTAGDTDFWIGVQEDGGADDNDSFVIGEGLTTGSNALLTITSTGTIELGATTDPAIEFSPDGADSDFVIGVRDDDDGVDNDVLVLSVGDSLNTPGLAIDATGQVGVGTSAPSTALDVVGIATVSDEIQVSDGSASDPSYLFTTDPDTGLFSSGADELGITAGAVEAIRIIESAGDISVGVGTTAPYTSAILDLSSTDQALRVTRLSTPSSSIASPQNGMIAYNSTDDILQAYVAGTWENLVESTSDVFVMMAGDSMTGTLDMNFRDPTIRFLAPSTDSDFTIGVSDDAGTDDDDVFTISRGTTLNTPLFTIATTGSIGIGTSAPRSNIDLVYPGGTGTDDMADIRVYNSTPNGSAQITLGENDGAGVLQGFNMRYFSASGGGVNNFEIISDDAGTVNRRLVIERGDGDVGIGNTAPEARLHVEEAAANAVIRVRATGGVVDPFILFDSAAGAGDISWALGMDDSGNDNFVIAQGDTLTTNQFLVMTTGGAIGVGTSSPASSAILDLSASDKALRVTRLSTPSSSIASPQNGMIAYNSTDDILQAYVAGTWENLVESTSDVFVMMAGDSMTGTLDMNFADASIRFIPAVAGDADFWVGVQDDASGDSTGDVFQIGEGTATGTNAYLTITTTGSVGIGDATPTAHFQISNTDARTTLLVEGTTEGVLVLGDSNDAVDNKYMGIFGSGEFLEVRTITDNLNSNGGEIIRISRGGDTAFETNQLFVDASANNIGIGTSTPYASTLLDLSATDKALRVTRLSTPSSSIASPQNGMIAYNSTDDEMQAYVNGTWSTLADTASGLFVLTAGDSMTGTLDMNFADASIRFIPAVAGDSDFWVGVQDDGAGDDNDTFQIGEGTATGTNSYFSMTTTGTITLSNNVTIDANGFMGIAGTLPISSSRLTIDDVESGTGTQVGLTLRTLKDVGNSTVYGISNDIDQTATTSGNIAGIFNDIDTTGFGAGTEIAAGIFNDVSGGTFLGGQVSGVYNNVTSTLINGTVSGVRNDVSTENDAETETGIGSYSRLTTYAGASDVAYGFRVNDATGASTGGTHYGLHVDLDDTDVTSYSIFVQTGSGESFFGSDIDVMGTLAIGTTAPGISTILDLSATNAALRVTRLVSPSANVASPQNGMIAYDSTDNELQAYVNGTWENLTATTSDVFVMMAGDSMTGTLEMSFRDPTIQFLAPDADSDFTIGIQDDAGADDNDVFIIGGGTTLNTPYITVTTTGTVSIGATTSTLVAGDAGRVGVGTSNPFRDLHIDAGSTDTQVLITGSATGQIILGDNDDAADSKYMGIFGSGEDIRFRTLTDSFSVSAEFFTIERDGDVRIGDTELFMDASFSNIGIGTSTPHSSSLLDLSSATQALRVTRLSTPSSSIASPQNGMIAYNSTDDELQAYVNGTWSTLADTAAGLFVLTAGDSMTGTLDMAFRDPSISFVAPGADSDFTIGVSDDGGSDDNDIFVIGGGTTLNTPYLTITTTGSVGIGTSAPSANFEVAYAGGITTDLAQIKLLNTTTQGSSEFIYAEETGGALDGFITRYNSDGGIINNFEFIGVNSGSENRHMLIERSSGYVGIGINSPAYTLEVDGTIGISESGDNASLVIEAEGGVFDPFINFNTTSSNSISWSIGLDDSENDSFVISEGNTLGVNTYFTLTSDGNVGIGATAPALSAILDLSASDKALRVTRLVSPSVNIASPSNGMIAYDSTDDELQAYINGTWSTLADTASGLFVLTAGDSMTGTLDMAFRDPSISFFAPGADSDFTIGVSDDSGTDDDDLFVIGRGTTLNNPLFVVTTDGSIGIGTTAPRANLEIAYEGGVTTDLANLRISNTTTQGSSEIIYSEPNGATFDGFRTRYFSDGVSVNNFEFIGVVTGVDTRHMVIERNSGNVGVGTTSPDYNLEVDGTIGITRSGNAQLFISATGADSDPIITFDTGGNPVKWTMGLDDSNGDAFVISEGDTVGATDYFVLTSDGRLGIGTSSPATSAILDLSASNAALRVTRVADPSVNIVSPQNGMIAYDSTDDELQAYVNGTWTTLADTDGNVFVMMAGDSMTGTLEMSFRDPTIQFLAPDADSDFTIGIQDDAGADDNDVFIIAGGTTLNTPYLTITTTGSVTLGATSSTFIVGDSGNIGVGTSQPSAPIHVAGLTSGADVLIESAVGGTANIQLRSGGALDSRIEFQLNGTDGNEFSIGVDNSDGDKFKISQDSSLTDNFLVVHPTGQVGLGTADSETSVLLDLSASDKALRVTRLSSPSGDVSTPRNGMIAYDSTDDELQAYVGGTWSTLADTAAGLFVLTAGDSMTGTLDMNFADASIRFIPAVAGDADFWVGVQDDASGDTTGDVFQIGLGTATGTNAFLTITTTGSVGIGDATPTAHFQVSSSDLNTHLLVEGTNGGNLVLGDSDDGLDAKYMRLKGNGSDISFTTINDALSSSGGDILNVYRIGDVAVQGNQLFVDDSADNVGIGTSTPYASTLLDLSATDKALRVTRLSTPSSSVASPQNGMIAYNSTDDELQAYIGGTWSTLADTASGLFVLTTGDSMTGTLDMAFRDPSISFFAPGADSDFTIGINDNADGIAQDDIFVISAGTTLNTPLVAITTNGNVGIGTTAPPDSLTIQVDGGDIRVDTLNLVSEITVGENPTTTLIGMRWSPGNGEFAGQIFTENSDLLLSPGGNDRLYLDEETQYVSLGTTTPDTSVILDLSSTDRALRVTRLSSPSGDITTPRNGMIAYNSTDDELQAYVGGTWSTLADTAAGLFVLTAGDSMTGTLDMKFDDSAIRFIAPTAGDSNFWVGLIEDGGADDNDTFQIGEGTSTGTGSFFTITTDGSIGIGTSTPQSHLHISGSSATDLPELRIENTVSGQDSQIIFEEGGQGNNMAIRYDGANNAMIIEGLDGTAIQERMILERQTGRVAFGENGVGQLTAIDSFPLDQAMLITGASGSNTKLRIRAGGGEFDPYINFDDGNTGAGWSIGFDDSASDSFVISQGDSLGDNDIFVITQGATVAIGTSSPGLSTILDLSATDKALRVTRLSTPSSSITSPQNGMIAYNSTDDELQAYIGGTWATLADTAGDVFVMMAGDSMTGTLDMNFADPSIRFVPAVAGDSDFWVGVQDDGAGDDNDSFQIGSGTTTGTNAYLTVTTTGTVTITGTLTVEAQAGNHGLIPAGTQVPLPLIQQKDITLLEPDQIKTVSGTIPMFTVDTYNYPSGIEITAVRLITSEDSTYDVEVEAWDSPDPSVGTQDLIIRIDTDNDREETETSSLSNTTVAAGRYIFLELVDLEDINYAKLTIYYYVRQSP